MGQLGAVRSVFVRQLSFAQQESPPAATPPVAAASSESRAAASTETAAPADASAPPTPLRDKPATVEEALEVMRSYVGAMARTFGRGRDYSDDLLQVGQLAVARAFETFRGDEGISFRGYAWKNARWKILREIRQEIYQTRNAKSGDAPLAVESELTLFDTLTGRQPPRATPGLGQLSARLNLAVPKLRGQQRVCVELLLKGRSQAEIAALFGVSHQRVQQIAALALVNLRKRITHGFIVERMEQREGQPISRAAIAASASAADPPEESSGALASTWPSSAERLPGHDYGRCYWRRAVMNESAEDGQAAGGREETTE
jgi:RNA polymerase sigma factor (sigma-70 family)